MSAVKAMQTGTVLLAPGRLSFTLSFLYMLNLNFHASPYPFLWISLCSPCVVLFSGDICIVSLCWSSKGNRMLCLAWKPVTGLIIRNKCQAIFIIVTQYFFPSYLSAPIRNDKVQNQNWELPGLRRVKTEATMAVMRS